MLWAVLPILVPMLGGVLCLAFLHRPVMQRLIALGVASVMLWVAIQTLLAVSDVPMILVQLGAWEAPFGISIVLEPLGALMIFGSSILLFATVIFSGSEASRNTIHSGFYPLVFLMIVGVHGAFLTHDLFNLYVWFEVFLMGSFGLMVVDLQRGSIKATVLYFIINSLASLFFLAGLGLLYSTAGTLNIADVAARVTETGTPKGFFTAVTLMAAGFLVKAGFLPFMSYIPKAYSQPSFAAAALFSGLLSKIGVFSLMKLFVLVVPAADSEFLAGLRVLSLVTMLGGVIVAAGELEIRRILGSHIVSQIGYMGLALSFGTELGLAACAFFVFHQIIVKSNLFLVAGAVQRASGSTDLSQTGGLWVARPLLGLLFLLSALSLAGLPPLSGFFAKLYLLRASLEVSDFIALAFAVGVSLLTLYSMLKIWIKAFWGKIPLGRTLRPVPFSMTLGIVILTASALAVGLSAPKVMSFAERGAKLWMDRSQYTDAVLGAVR